MTDLSPLRMTPDQIRLALENRPTSDDLDKTIGWMVTPEQFGARQDGVTDDRNFHQAAQNAAQPGQTIVITGPSFMGSAMGEGGKFIPRQTVAPIAWPDTLSITRAFPGIGSSGAAKNAAFVANWKSDVAETKNMVYWSFRTEPSDSAENFQSNAAQIHITCADPSEPDPGGGEFAIRRGAVALMPRADIAAGNTSAAIWALNPYATVPTGTEGAAVGCEINVDNFASEVAGLSAANQKVGLQIVPKKNALTVGVILRSAGTGGYLKGFVVRSGVINAAGTSAYEYEGLWRVDRAGDVYLGKATGADTEQGIALKQNGDAVLTKSAGIASFKTVRAGAMGAAGSAANWDIDAQTSAGTQRTVGRVQSWVSSPTNGAEDAELRFLTMRNGTLTQNAAVGIGMTVGGSGLAMPGAGIVNAANAYWVNGLRVVGARRTGWTVPTGPRLRTFDTATVTVSQLAQVVAAIIDDINATTGHGLIGA